MKAKEYLSKIRKIDMYIDSKCSELKYMKAKMYSVKGVRYEVERVQTSMDTDASFTKLAHKYIDMVKEIDQETDKFVDMRKDILEQMQKLSDPRYIKIISKRYFEYKSMEIIADEMLYSVKNIWKLHREALKEFEKILSVNGENKV